MLFENVFQSREIHLLRRTGCDLMLFENVFQFVIDKESGEKVVI